MVQEYQDCNGNRVCILNRCCVLRTQYQDIIYQDTGLRVSGHWAAIGHYRLALVLWPESIKTPHDAVRP